MVPLSYIRVKYQITLWNIPRVVYILTHVIINIRFSDDNHIWVYALADHSILKLQLDQFNISEQSHEGYHQTCTKVFDLFKTQRGIERVEYAIRRLMFVTSSLYRI